MSDTTSKAKIVFFAEEVTLAHVSRPLILAESLKKEKYNISFACGSKYKKLIEDSGYKVHHLPSIPQEKFLERLSKGSPLYTQKDLEKYIRKEKEILSATSPDLIVGDFRISLGITADLFKTPYIALTNAHWSRYSTQRFPVPELKLANILGTKNTKILFNYLEPIIFWYHARNFNNIRKKYKLLPVGNMKDVYTYGTHTFYTDIPSIAPTSELPDNHKYVGPVIWSPPIDLPDWWETLPKDKPLIYITMGSSGDVSLMEKIIKVFEDRRFIALVATAGRCNIRSAQNIFASDYLPGIEVIKKASMAICSGGSATAYQALSLGVPVVGFPSNADQFYTMGSIKNNNAGILIRPSQATVESIKSAIAEILNNSKYKVSAEKLALEITEINSQRLFPQLVDSIITSVK